METLRNCIFLGSKTSADRDCSHEINRRWLLGRKAMTNRDSMFKSRDITLPTEVPIVIASAVWMGEMDLQKAEHQRTEPLKP